MKWFLAFLTITGFNFTFWGLVSLSRFATEKIHSSVEQHKSLVPLEPVNKRWLRPLISEEILGRVGGIGAGVIVSLFGFALLTQLASNIAERHTALIQAVSTYIVVLHLFFSALGGYITARIEHVAPIRSAVITGIFFWFFLLIFPPLNGLSSLSAPHAAQAFTLAIAGGFLGIIMNILYASEERRLKVRNDELVITREGVAAIIPAHNEEVTIRRTIEPLTKILPKKNIFVGSDASTDKTVEIVRSLGCNVLDIQPNKGKAAAIVSTLNHFDITKKFKAVIIVDADTEIDERYLERALPLLRDPRVAAVAGHVISRWHPHQYPLWSMFFTAYRIRVYRVLQAVMRYGQTWKYSNVTSIVPGFASIYRTSAIRRITIDAPGLIIEDFNMTFELHKKRLGMVAYDPGVIGFTEDPHTLRDYVRQIKRWDLGFWQTVRRHGVWQSSFWLSLTAFLVEILPYSLLFLLAPVFLLWFATHSFQPLLFSVLGTAWIVQFTFLDILLGIFLADYVLTVAVAIVERKPVLLLYGLGFGLLRYVDSFMFLYTLPLAFTVKSKGRWTSPKRRTALRE